MARLAALIKGCYVPADPKAVGAVLKHLKAPPGPFSLLDPCAGCGHAIKQLAEGLNSPLGNVCAIELSDTRAVELHRTLAGARICAPASFEGTSISPHSLGMVYVNAPFADQLGGGGREEYNFLLRSTRLLVTRG